ncbi:S1C family serine protease [Deinococcus radiomollis]|uniref:S1C family serine protease n=1 Tax=Deinococcus radiomollis TaxID=468916 RepID=UPI00389298CF
MTDSAPERAPVSSRWLLLASLLLASLGGAYLTGRVTAQRALVTTEEINTVEVTQRALPALVRVDVRIRKDQLQPGEDPTDVGSGFFYRPNLIVTNYHVVQFQESLSVVMYDGKRVNATVEGVDPGIDIAILKVTGVTAPKTLSFGDSSRLIPGQKMIALGTPLKYNNFVSTGVFSATTRDLGQRADGLGQEIGQYGLTTATIQGGSSGGPVLDSRGTVIGVADANASSNTLLPGVIGAFIPSELVSVSLADLEKIGVPQRGTLGVTLVDLDNLDPALRQLAGLTSNQGALVDEVPAGTAGARSGLRGSLRNNKGQLLAPLGDVVVAVDGKRIASSYDLIRAVALKRPGQVVALKVWRNKKEATVNVTLLKRTLQ